MAGEYEMAEKTGITHQIRKTILDVLEGYPGGIRRRDLSNQVQERDPAGYNLNTIHAQVSRLCNEGKIDKPSPGIFRENDQSKGDIEQTATTKEEDFYEPFADYLENDLEECTKAIPLGGSIFKNKWGTPDVIGIKKPLPGDIISAPMEVISAEIKINTSQLVTAFGQACAYCLFSHRSYLVVPRQAEVEISRLDSLCQVFGVGLVLFDHSNPDDPDFNIRVRGRKQDPDLFYTNQNLPIIKEKLF